MLLIKLFFKLKSPFNFLSKLNFLFTTNKIFDIFEYDKYYPLGTLLLRNYRNKKELLYWKKNDPIKILQNFLIKKKWINQNSILAMIRILLILFVFLLFPRNQKK